MIAFQVLLTDVITAILSFLVLLAMFGIFQYHDYWLRQKFEFKGEKLLILNFKNCEPMDERVNVFKARHRIRVEISSSNFPRFNRNPNTGRPIGEETELRPAVQTILHDMAHPSHIVLPIIPRGEA